MDYLCKCVTCISKNPDGILLSNLIFNRHRRREQFLSIRDDENIDQVEVHDQENIIENIDDIEDFDDLEIISNNEEDDDDDEIVSQNDEKEEDDEEEEEDDDIDEDEDDDNENAMQIEDHNIISQEVIDGLQLLYFKSKHNFTQTLFDDFMKTFIIKKFGKKGLSLYKAKKLLERLTGLVPTFYDMCENSCICYTKIYESF